MTAPRNNRNWSLIFSVLSFVIGYAINAGSNYLSYTHKVDQLTQAVEKMSDKIDNRDERENRISGRVTALEVKVFGQMNAVNYTFNDQIKCQNQFH